VIDQINYLMNNKRICTDKTDQHRLKILINLPMLN